MKRFYFLCAAAALSAFAQNYTSYNNQPVARESFLRSQWTGGNIFGDSSLIAYWPLTAVGGTFNDFSGHGITATFSGLPSSPFAGKIAPLAPYFNKATPNSLTVLPTPVLTVPFTVSAWVKPSSPTGGYTRILETDYAHGVYLGLDTTMTKFLFIVNNSAVGACSGGTVTTGSWSTSLWQMVTGVYNGTNGYLYVNGVQVAGPCAFTSPGTTTLPMKVGYCAVASYCSGAIGGWDGQIAGLRIYGRALSAAEILAIYTAENH